VKKHSERHATAVVVLIVLAGLIYYLGHSSLSIYGTNACPVLPASLISGITVTQSTGGTYPSPAPAQTGAIIFACNNDTVNKVWNYSINFVPSQANGGTARQQFSLTLPTTAQGNAYSKAQDNAQIVIFSNIINTINTNPNAPNTYCPGYTAFSAQCITYANTYVMPILQMLTIAAGITIGSATSTTTGTTTSTTTTGTSSTTTTINQQYNLFTDPNFPIYAGVGVAVAIIIYTYYKERRKR
jgi:hypothetical protein